jgi:hypothetical protein
VDEYFFKIVSAKDIDLVKSYWSNQHQYVTDLSYF